MRVKRLLKAGVTSTLACMVKADSAILTDQTKELLARWGCSRPGLGSEGTGARRLGGDRDGRGINERMSHSGGLEWRRKGINIEKWHGGAGITVERLHRVERGHCPSWLPASQALCGTCYPAEERHSFCAVRRGGRQAHSYDTVGETQRVGWSTSRHPPARLEVGGRASQEALLEDVTTQWNHEGRHRTMQMPGRKGSGQKGQHL